LTSELKTRSSPPSRRAVSRFSSTIAVTGSLRKFKVNRVLHFYGFWVGFAILLGELSRHYEEVY